MMFQYKNLSFFFLTTFLCYSCLAQKPVLMAKYQPLIPFEMDDNTTSTYEEIAAFYKNIGNSSEYLKVSDFGMTDSGFPLQEVVIASGKQFSPEESRKAGKAILFINNGIHPGEPDGIDASMLFVKELINNSNLLALLDKLTIVLVPVYNIGGALNRNSHTRANQNGPRAYGFRGNTQNLDLNRDFVKCDSKNAKTFNQLFNKWNPDVLIDTHTSNGADYQYTMTLIATQKDKLHPLLGSFMTDKMLPELYQKMEEANWPMIPYVNAKDIPDDGIYGFMDHPRYSSGYAAMHHTISFMPETHMLKPYKDRVISTLEFLKISTQFLYVNGTELASIRKNIKELSKTQKEFPLSYELQMDNLENILFKGYQAGRKPSAVSGIDRLYYDRSKPFEKMVPFYNNFKTTLTVSKPTSYIIPQAYEDIISKMILNGVEVEKLENDQVLEVELYKIEDFKTTPYAFEGHYLHSNVKLSKKVENVHYRKGDFVIKTNQECNRYIVECLEPQGVDSWFAWNFFDGILMQKEHFSDYVFEDTAEELLKSKPELLAKLEQKKKDDPKFAKDGSAQLEFIYMNSPYYELTHNLYPVGRTLKF